MDMIPLANLTLSSAAPTVTISNIPTVVGPKTLRDLYLVISANSTVNYSEGRLRFNGSTASEYTSFRIIAEGGSVYGGGNTVADAMQVGVRAYTFFSHMPFTININNFGSTATHKPVVSTAQSIAGYEMFASRWANNSAVTSLTFFFNTGNVAVGSNFELYGIVG